MTGICPEVKVTVRAQLPVAVTDWGVNVAGS